MIKISIVTIGFNDVQGFKKTIASIRNQTFSKFEYIVIDGGSTDDSVALIKSSQDVINYWVSEKDKGVYDAMNKGIAVAKGDYLIFMNSGDEFYAPTVLSDFAAQSPSADIIYGATHYIKPNGETREIRKYPEKIHFSWLRHYTICQQSTFYKTSYLKKSGGFDAGLRIVSDWKFLAKATCLSNCSYKYLDIIVSKFYEGGISSNPKFAATFKAEKEKILKEDFAAFYDDYTNMDHLKYKLNKLKYLNPVKLIKKLTKQ